MQMICILLGGPESDRHWLFEAVEPGFDFPGSRKASISRLSVEDAGSQMYAYGSTLVAQKRADPADDMLSIVASATIDDPQAPGLTDAELYLFFYLLFSAGAETTRNSIAGGLLALAERPDSYRRLRENPELLPTAVEEMVRWTSPSPSKRRTATRAAELGGQPIGPGPSAGSTPSGLSSRSNGHAATGTPESGISSSNWASARRGAGRCPPTAIRARPAHGSLDHPRAATRPPGPGRPTPASPVGGWPARAVRAAARRPGWRPRR